jgi:hypothetical protein
MRQQLITIASMVACVLLLSACSSVTKVSVDSQFPAVNSYPKDIKATVIFDQEFRSYLAKPNSKIVIDMADAQVALLRNGFRGLFSQVEFVNSRELAAADSQIFITPQVREVQATTPSDTYLNVYEVWIKYNLEIEHVDGAYVNNWFLPAYGKTPDAFMLSKAEAIQAATNIALRDAGAKLLLDFYRIPSVNDWYQRLLKDRQQAMASDS